jgi:hypothetical protein
LLLYLQSDLALWSTRHLTRPKLRIRPCNCCQLLLLQTEYRAPTSLYRFNYRRLRCILTALLMRRLNWRGLIPRRLLCQLLRRQQRAPLVLFLASLWAPLLRPATPHFAPRRTLPLAKARKAVGGCWPRQSRCSNQDLLRLLPVSQQRLACP